MQPIPDGLWENNVTVRSTRAARAYEPGIYIGRFSPTLLLIIVGDNDRITRTDLALEAYQRAFPPTELPVFPGGHSDAYLGEFEATSGAALQWFTKHLMKDG